MVQQHPNPRDRILLLLIGVALLVVLLPCLWPPSGAAHQINRFPAYSANQLWNMLLVLVLAICVPVAVWFYFWQNEVKTRQVSVRSLLWLILAVSIGLSFGSWIAGPTIRRGLGLPWAQWQAESRRSSPRGRRAAARQFCPTDCLVPAVALR